MAYLSVFALMGCGNRPVDRSTVAVGPPPEEKKRVDLLPAGEIKQYPFLFSYATDRLKDDLEAKATKPLTKEEKQLYFKDAPVPYEVSDKDYQVFPVNKISYANSLLMIYLIRQTDVSSYHENDQLLLMMYDKERNPMDGLTKNLQDVFSTREIRFTSRYGFEVIDTDTEYSPDPESEAEDIKNGYVPTASVLTYYYEIDSVGCKFIQQIENNRSSDVGLNEKP